MAIMLICNNIVHLLQLPLLILLHSLVCWSGWSHNFIWKYIYDVDVKWMNEWSCEMRGDAKEFTNNILFTLLHLVLCFRSNAQIYT